jgi:hypothetical protein
MEKATTTIIEIIIRIIIVITITTITITRIIGRTTSKIPT